MKTAVEWLHYVSKQRELDKFDWEQAKEMEKDQIVEAFGDGAMDTLKLGKEYYNYLYTKQ
jgi:hypothetical protein